MLTFQFFPEGLEQCREWGRQRNENTERVKVRDHIIKIEGYSGVESHTDGVKAEYAVAYILGAGKWQPVLNGPDAGVDVPLNSGRTCAVKYIRRARRFATAKYWLECQVGVAVVPVEYSADKVKVVGWTTQEEFKAKAQMHDFGVGYGKQPTLPFDRLRPMESLVAEESKFPSSWALPTLGNALS